jgi:hypothetical protein
MSANGIRIITLHNRTISRSVFPVVTFGVVVEEVSVADGGGIVHAEVHLQAALPLPELEDGNLGRDELYVWADGVAAVAPQQLPHPLQVGFLVHGQAALRTTQGGQIKHTHGPRLTYL